MVAGVSSLGVSLSYGVETTTDTKPTSFTELNRINTIGGVSLSTEQIDASALFDKITRYIGGRQDTGGTFPVTINLTDETIAEWTAVISAYDALDTDKRMWFQVSAPKLEKAFFIVAQPPETLPMPEFSQNTLLTAELTLIIEEYKGMDAKVAPTGGEGDSGK
jgi:hypothetical protein